MKEIVTSKTKEGVDLLTGQPLSNYIDEEDIKVSFNNADINVDITKPIDETILRVQGILAGDSIEMTIKTSSIVESSPEDRIELAHIVNGIIRVSNPFEVTIDKKDLTKSKETLGCTIRDNLLETKFIRRQPKMCKKHII